MLRFWRLWLLPLLLTFFAAATVGAAEGVLVIVSSERSPAYEEAAQAMVDELVHGGVLSRQEVLQLTAAELGGAGVLTPRLFVALGAQACGVLAKAEGRRPILCALLPRTSFERVLAESGRQPSGQLTALYLNQPLARQMELIRLALPRARRVGVLWGEESRSQQAALEAAAQSRGLKLMGAQVRPAAPIFTELKKVLDEADLLLALPDPQIYNSASIQNILLSSFRAQVPMLAFSPAYVRAGALLAVHSTPLQIGRQAGVMAQAAFQGRPLGAPQYPQDFSVSVNEHVARSLGLSLEARDLTERLRRMERGL
jgi:ABC-type uncharacterized transport system substrate-binding protein